MILSWGWRKIAVVCISFLLYAFVIHFMIWGVAEITTTSHMIGYVFRLIWVGILIASVTLLVIEFQHIKSWIWYVTILSGFVLSVVIGGAYVADMLPPFLMLLLFHGGLLALILNKQKILGLYRRVSIQHMIQIGVRNFVVVITLCLCLMIAHGWKSVDINCEKLYAFFNKAGEVVSLPGWSGEAKSLEQFSDATIADILGIDAIHIESILTQVGDINIDMLLSGDNTKKTKEIAGSLQTWKHFLTEELMEDKDIINKGFCSLIVEQIEKRQRSGLFLYSTTILLFFLLFPLLKLFFWITDSVTYLLVKLLFLLGVYKKSKEMGEIETID